VQYGLPAKNVYFCHYQLETELVIFQFNFELNIVRDQKNKS